MEIFYYIILIQNLI